MIAKKRMSQIKYCCKNTNIPWRTMAVLCLFAFVPVVYYWLAYSTGQVYTFIISLIGISFSLLTGLACCKGSRTLLKQGARYGGQRFSPLLLGMGIIFFALTEFIWFVTLAITRHIPAFPAPQHFVSFLCYLCFISAILLLPAQPLTRLARLRLLLDGLIIMAIVVTLCYYFILAPALVTGQGTVQAKVVASLFPVADLAALFCLLLVTLRFSEKQLRPVLIMLGLALILLFIDHVAHISDILHYHFNQLTMMNIILFPGAILLAGAAQTIRRVLEKSEGVSPAPKKVARAGLLYPVEHWKALLPSALLLIFGLFILGIWLTGGARHFHGQILIVYTGGFVVLLLMVSRQFLSIHEMRMLRVELQRKNLSLHVLNTHLEQRATSDPLTGLPNHRALVERLDEALARASVTHVPCALLFIDIDYFKDVNDLYGHVVGDRILREFALLVREALRVGDCVGRWGGEEFVAILPGVGSSGAFVLAERVRSQIAQQRFICGKTLHLTCSLGIAAYPEDATERKNLLAHADMAMYVAKRLGRNQTRVAQEPEVLATRLAGESARLSDNMDVLGTVDALLFLQQTRDHPTVWHERRVSELSLILARTLGLSEAEADIVSLGGLLHDLGTIALPDELLLNQPPGRAREAVAVHRHPLTCARALRSIPALQDVANIVSAHHERIDGSGYPKGLWGEEIPLGARIVAVADAYDVMIHTRSAHQARTPAEALDELKKNAGSQFDTRAVAALARLFETHPEQLVCKIPGQASG